MPGPEIQILWSSVARPIIGGDEPDEYIYIYISIYIYRVINEHADRCTLGQPSRALLRPSIVDG